MTRLKFSFFFALSLAAICFSFYQISKINIQQSRDETQLRLAQGERALQSVEALEARLRLAALSSAMQGRAALDSLDAVIFPAEGGGRPAAMSALRQGVAAALSTTAYEVLAPQDLLLVQSGELLWAIGGAAAGARTFPAGAEGVDLEAALDPAGRYARFQGELYRLSALKLMRRAPAPAPAEGAQPRAAMADGEGAPEMTALVAIARHLDAAALQKRAALLGVEMAIVAGEAVIASRDEGEQLRQIAAQRTSGPLALAPFDRLPFFPLALPLFLENPASHQAHVLPLAGVESGRIVLDTQMDGLLMLAYVQKYFLIGLLGFVAVGIFFFFLMGGEGVALAEPVPAARLRKVPIAGQSISKAPFSRAKAPSGAAPTMAEGQRADEDKRARGGGREMALLEAPRVEEQVPKTLTPDEFNFGNSPLAEELSPQPQAPAPEALSPAPLAEAAPAGGTEALVAEEDPQAEEAYQVAAEDFAPSLDSYPYAAAAQVEAPLDAGGAAPPYAYPVQDSSQIYEGKTPVPGLYGAAEGYQPAVPAGPESLEAFYDDAAGFEREATRQMSLEALNALNALQAGAAGTAPIWDPSSGNDAADYGDYGQVYGGAYGAPEQSEQMSYVDYVDEDPDEAHFREIYEQFVALRAECGEQPSSLTYAGFVLKLRKNREQLMQKYGCATVRFQVYVKEGRAALKATPVRS